MTQTKFLLTAIFFMLTAILCRLEGRKGWSIIFSCVATANFIFSLVNTQL